MAKVSRLATRKERNDYIRRLRKRGIIVTYLMPKLTLKDLRELIRGDHKKSALIRFKRFVKKIKRRVVKRLKK